MKTKYFTASEQEALEVFNKLNALTEEGLISILRPCFTHFEKMFIGPITKDKNHYWSTKRTITFVEKRQLNFAVKVVLIALTSLFDKKDRTNIWSPEEIIVGKLNFSWNVLSNWVVVEQEKISYSEKLRRFEKDPGPILKTQTLLKDFISSA